MTPELHTFDWIVINSSAGKDSQTMLAEVVRQADSQGIPRERLVVVHCDLGRVEWPGTVDLARRQAEHYGLRFIIAKRTQNDLLDHVRARKMWPSPQQRYCTSDHKRGPVHVVLTALVRETEYLDGPTEREAAGPVRILNCMGHRAEESPARAKKTFLAFDKRASNGRREVWQWLPIHTWTLEQVWTDIKASGVPHHPAYDLGMPRLSCCFCIFAPVQALVVAGKHNPELLGEYVATERDINHKFRVDVSLEDIQRAVEAGKIPAVVDDWRM